MKRNKKRNVIPEQTSFGGSLGFASGMPKPSLSSLNSKPTPKSTGNVTWNVDFINNTSIVGNQEFTNGIAILQQQINDDFLPSWSIGAQLSIVTAPRGHATIYVVDNSDVPGDLGYHDATQAEIPIGFVFAKTAKESGDSWTNTGSHELMELLLDPYANLAAEGQFIGNPAFFAYECCDPVEADGGYHIKGIQVSNFVLPSWFIPQTAPNHRYDHLKTLDAPFTIGSGGSLSYFRGVGDWQDVTSNQFLPSIHGRYTRKYKRRKRSNPNYGAIPHAFIAPTPHTHD